MEKKIQELCLLLMYLTGWEEESRQKPGEKIFRAWKGYLFEVLNRLADDKLIVQFANTKSVTLTVASDRGSSPLEYSQGMTSSCPGKILSGSFSLSLLASNIFMYSLALP